MSPIDQLAASLPGDPSLRGGRVRTPEHESRFRANLLSEKDLAGLVHEDVMPVVEDLLMEGTVNLLVGDSGLGKTPLLTQLALAVATGTPFLGLQTRPGKVLFCDAESAGGYFLSYIRSQKAFMGVDPPEDGLSCYLSNVKPHDEALVSDFEVLLAEKMDLLGPKLVIVDCLRPFWPDAEGKSEVASRVIRACRALATKHKAAIVIVHHRRKNSRDKNIERPNLETDARDWLEEAAGTRALINQTDTRLGVDYAKASGMAFPEETYALAGFSKFTGLILPSYFVRVYDEHGRPRGYAPASPKLNEEDARIFNLLPSPYTYSQAFELKGGKSHRSVAEMLKRYVLASVAKGHGMGRGKFYTKEVDHVDAV